MPRPRAGAVKRNAALGAALLAQLLLVAPLGAQAAAIGELTGRVTSGTDRPVFGATVRLQLGATVREVRSGPDGRYRMTGLADGSWIYSVQAVGYRRAVGRIAYAGPAMMHDFSIERLPTQLDSVLIASDWHGVRLSVGDASALTPLAGARVHVVTPKDTVQLADASGRTDIERPPGTDITLTVEHPGYARRIVQAKVPARGALDVIVTLDSAAPGWRDEMAWQDMLQRVRSAGPRAIAIGREELVATGARSLKEASREIGSFVRAVAVLARDACLFVDGRAMPGMPAEAINVDEIDFVEMYPPGADYSRTLEARWPKGAQCGAPVELIEERRLPDEKILYVVIWTRARKKQP